MYVYVLYRYTSNIRIRILSRQNRLRVSGPRFRHNVGPICAKSSARIPGISRPRIPRSDKKENCYFVYERSFYSRKKRDTGMSASATGSLGRSETRPTVHSEKMLIPSTLRQIARLDNKKRNYQAIAGNSQVADECYGS